MNLTRCRGCQSEHLDTIYDFGFQPLAGSYPKVPNSVVAEKKFPLDLTQCRECGLLQVINLPPINLVFHDNYRYSSSTIPGLVRHFEQYADWLARHLQPGARVLEFGCNDGILLLPLQNMGFICKGIDASENVAALARAKGLDVSTGFLSEELLQEIGLARKFDLVTCSNVFAHIDDLSAVLRAVRFALGMNGLFAVEVHDGELVSREGQFDSIYHEHLTYYTETTLRELLERGGFSVIACDKTAMHGGGLRLIARLTDQVTDHARSQERVEILNDFITPAIARCRADLERLFAEHGPLAGYGAAGRSQMFINMTRSEALFHRVFDDSPLRQGRYIAGTDIPITPYANESGNCVVILAWNYAEDIHLNP
ncbi:class I SAM-dependent methyltransferase [Serpentinimonas maccroryi]|uniref:class I SAM-dependent methyltransferase n=1 Tax=Serpentinimonas maccroryi TaxID=1458426 RepID=UPI002034142B|nr:class I SAM-dependent methyltransferase [Serpentinimonas maccroryi]MCM2477862.1 class I SAM-dependent methyltransferase [Serpentinimonas maccroryi]